MWELPKFKLLWESIIIFKIHWSVKIIRGEQYYAANDICNKDGNNDESEHIVNIKDKVLMDNGFIITLRALERL